MRRDLAHYFCSRLATPRIGLLWLLLLLLGWDSRADASLLCLNAGWLLLTLWALRLWDDMASASADAARHPDRVMVQTHHKGMFGDLVVLSLLLSLACLAQLKDKGHVLAEACLIGVLAWAYAAGRHASRVWIVLLKYPVLVMAIHPDPMSPSALMAAGGAYVVVALHELIDIKREGKR